MYGTRGLVSGWKPETLEPPPPETVSYHEIWQDFQRTQLPTITNSKPSGGGGGSGSVSQQWSSYQRNKDKEEECHSEDDDDGEDDEEYVTTQDSGRKRKRGSGGSGGGGGGGSGSKPLEIQMDGKWAERALKSRGINPDDAMAFMERLDSRMTRERADRILADIQQKRASNKVTRNATRAAQDLERLYDNHISAYKKDHAPPTAYEVLTQDPREIEMSNGASRLAQFNEGLRNHLPPRSSFQEMFHDLCIPTLLPFIFGKQEFNRYYTDILEVLDRDVMWIMVVLYFYRRGGKTDGAARLGAMLLDLAPDGIKILSVAQNLQMAEIFVAEVLKYFMQAPNAEQRIWKKSKGILEVFPRGVDIEMARADKSFRQVNRIEACAGTLKSK